MKLSRISNLFIIALLTISVNLFVWFPFLSGLGEGMLTVFKNYDGPNYLIAAKCWYQKDCITHTFSLPTPAEYFPAHLPGYPLTISFFNLFSPGPWAMLISTTLFTILAALIFYLFILKFKYSSNPIFLTFLFLVLPARWLVVHTIGSPEPLFIFAILASFYFFKSAISDKKENLFSPFKSITFDFFLAGLFGALAQITKTPGILLFGAYLFWLVFLAIKERKFYWQAWPLLLIPLSIIPIFGFYQHQIGDFWAYFHSGDNFHLVFPPLQLFNSSRSWLGSIWVEDMVWQYLIGALAVIYLVKNKYFDLAAFGGIFFAATLFVAHRDLARYSLPLLPFALISFDKFLQTKEFKIALLIILPAIYLFTINFILGNTAPIADWKPYL